MQTWLSKNITEMRKTVCTLPMRFTEIRPAGQRTEKLLVHAARPARSRIFKCHSSSAPGRSTLQLGCTVAISLAFRLQHLPRGLRGEVLNETSVVCSTKSPRCANRIQLRLLPQNAANGFHRIKGIAKKAMQLWLSKHKQVVLLTKASDT